MLDNVYMNNPGVYHAEPQTHLGYSDHISVLLIFSVQSAHQPIIMHMMDLHTNTHDT